MRNATWLEIQSHPLNLGIKYTLVVLKQGPKVNAGKGNLEVMLPPHGES